MVVMVTMVSMLPVAMTRVYLRAWKWGREFFSSQMRRNKVVRVAIRCSLNGAHFKFPIISTTLFSQGKNNVLIELCYFLLD